MTEPRDSSEELVSITMGARAANNLALACNRARNMLTDFMDAEEWPADERDQAMLETLGWASRWLVGDGAQIERGV